MEKRLGSHLLLRSKDAAELYEGKSRTLEDRIKIRGERKLSGLTLEPILQKNVLVNAWFILFLLLSLVSPWQLNSFSY